MKDLAAHIPATLDQHGHADAAQAVRELYAAVKRLRSAKPEPLSAEAVRRGGWALDRLSAEQQAQVGEESCAEMERWLAQLAERYQKALDRLAALDETVSAGDDPGADVAGDHGAIATLLGGLLG